MSSRLLNRLSQFCQSQIEKTTAKLEEVRGSNYYYYYKGKIQAWKEILTFVGIDKTLEPKKKGEEDVSKERVS